MCHSGDILHQFLRYYNYAVQNTPMKALEKNIHIGSRYLHQPLVCQFFYHKYGNMTVAELDNSDHMLIGRLVSPLMIFYYSCAKND